MGLDVARVFGATDFHTLYSVPRKYSVPEWLSMVKLVHHLTE